MAPLVFNDPLPSVGAYHAWLVCYLLNKEIPDQMWIGVVSHLGKSSNPIDRGGG